MVSAMLVEIPVGNAVDGGDDPGVRPEQRLHRVDRTGDGMRLQAHDHEILVSELGWIVGAVRPHHVQPIADQQFEPVLAHCGEMRAARDQADVGAGACKVNPKISADRAGAVDADFHDNSPRVRGFLDKNFPPA